MSGVLALTGGFLLAVLWMDLIFDVQARQDGPVLDEPVLNSITGYYGRATNQPMSKLIAVVMVLLIAALAAEAVRGDSPGWLIGVSLVLAGVPIAVALSRTVPNAVRLGQRTGTPAEQSALARSILRDHIICLVGIASFVALWAVRSLN